jgi:hypothetical protein
MVMAMVLTGHLSMPDAGTGGACVILISMKKCDISWYVRQYVTKGALI